MKNIVKKFLLASVVLTVVACGTQKNTSNNNERRAQQGGQPNTSQLLAEMDANKDGKLSKTEVKGPLQNDFEKIDSNNDGFISKAELENAPKPQRGQGPRQN